MIRMIGYSDILVIGARIRTARSKLSLLTLGLLYNKD